MPFITKLVIPFFFKEKYFIYLREKEYKLGGKVEGEADSPLSWEPDLGLNPRIRTRAEGRCLTD